MNNDAIYMRREAPVASIILNRPEKRNALTPEMWQRLPELLDAFEADDSLRVLILRGKDATAFSAGADIESFADCYKNKKTAEQTQKQIATAMQRLYDCPKPTIAMIQGPCVGGGLGLAVCCDLRFSDRTAQLGITPARLGLVYDLVNTKRLINLIGPSLTKDVLFSGRILKAEEAHKMRLIDRLHTHKSVEADTKAYAEAVAANSAYSTHATKKIVRMIIEGAEEETKESQSLVLDAYATPDFKEGLTAFKERRRPDFIKSDAV